MSLQKILAKLDSRLSKQTGIIAGALCPVLLCASAFALYDVQTAQGVGLYLSVRLNIHHTLMVDILCNAVFMLVMLLLIIVPCLVLKYKRATSILRFLVLYMALIPAISTAYLIHLGDGHALYSLHPALLSKDIRQVLTDASASLLPLLQLMIPALILLYGCYRTLNDNSAKTAHTKTPLPNWHKAFIVIAFIFLVPMVIFPELTPVSEYIIWYLLLLICFDLWEKLVDDKPCLQSASHVITVVLILRSIYRLLYLMSNHSL